MAGSDDGGDRLGSDILADVCAGYLGRKPSDGDTCGRRFPVEGVVSPVTSSTGENPVHS
jgi:hypothetical protein